MSVIAELTTKKKTDRGRKSLSPSVRELSSVCQIWFSWGSYRNRELVSALKVDGLVGCDSRKAVLVKCWIANRILRAEDREHVIGVFLNLSKAFDTVNHVMLFDKLEHYRIRGLALEWVKSYFSERKQLVEFNNVRSSPQRISCGVPQGSILGPLFFILFVNDLNNASVLDAILFTDDTNLFISHNDSVYLINTLNRELNKLST